jgi:PAS domain S-box-containing protein
MAKAPAALSTINTRGDISALPPPVVAPALRVLTNISAIRQLSPMEAGRGYSVRVRGVATYSDRDGTLFIQDSTAGIWVDCLTNSLGIRQGQQIELEGESASGSFAPILKASSIQVIGPGSEPPAPMVRLEDLLTGDYDSQWVQFEGVLRSTRKVNDRLVLSVASRQGSLNAWFPPDGENHSVPLVDSHIRLRGVCASEFNQRGQLVHVHLMVPSLAYLKILESGPADPFSLPVKPVGALFRFHDRNDCDHLVHLQGIVTLHEPGKRVVLQDAADGIFVESDQRDPLEPGDRIDVVGFPDGGGYAPHLDRGVYRKQVKGPPATPMRVNPNQAVGNLILGGVLDARLVQLQARFLSRATTPAEEILLVETENQNFKVILPRRTHRGLSADSQRSISELREGSILELTGVCFQQLDGDHVIQSFELRLRSPADVRVLQQASWWTARHSVTVAWILMATTLFGLVWIKTLHGKLRRQTNQIQHQLQLDGTAKWASHASSQHRSRARSETPVEAQSRFPAGSLAGVLLLTLTLCGWSAWSAFHSRQVNMNATAKSARLIELRGIIMQLDEVLTMSARMAAATEDRQWEDRYHRFEPKLDAAIKEALRMETSPAILKTAGRTDAANLKLVDLEQRAFALVNAGQAGPARALLSSPEYEAQKRAYSDGMAHLMSLLAESMETRRANELDQTKRNLLVIVMGLAVAVWLWRRVVRSLWEGRRGLIVELAARIRAEEALRKEQENLEGRVQERTACLEVEIRQRNEVEQSLRIKERDLEAAQRVAHLGSWRVDLVHPNLWPGRLHCSAETFRIFGYEPDQVEPSLEMFYNHVPPSERQAVRDAVSKALQTRSTCRIQHRIQRRDGEERVVRQEGEFAFDELGQPVHLLGFILDVTEEAQASAQILEAEKKYRSLFELSTEAFMISDSKGFVDCNEAAVRMFGYSSREDILGRHPRELSPHRQPESQDSETLLRTQLEAAYVTGHQDFEWMHQRKDGSIFPADVSLSRIMIDGKPYIQGVVRDITERKRIQEAIASSEARYRQLVDESPDMIFIGCDRKIAYVNAAGLRLLGACRPEQIVGRPVMDFIHPDDRKIVSARMAGQKPGPPLEEKYLRLDGTIVYVEVTAIPLLWEGKPGAQVIVHDLSLRKQAEEALRQRESEMAEAQRIAHLGSWRVDLTVAEDQPGSLVWSEETFRIFGYSPGQITPTRMVFFERIHPADQQRVREAVSKALSEKSPYRIEHRVRNSNGEEREVLEQGEVVLNPEGQAIGLRGVVLDVTDRKRQEAELLFKTSLLEAESETTPDGLLVVDAEGKVMLVNNRFREIWSIPAEVLAKRSDEPILRLVIDQVKSPEIFLERINHLYANPHEESRDEIELKDGTVLDRYSAPLKIRKSETIGRIWYFRDITELRRASDKLRLQANALEAAANSIAITDAKGTIQWVNSAFTRLTGYTEREAVGQNPRILKSGQQNEVQYQNLWQTITSGQVWRGEMVNRRKDGTVYTEEMTITPVRNAQGNDTNFIAIKQDISERKETEAKMAALHRELVETARQAGMAEVASSVLHNVGNVLNCVNVASTLAIERIRNSKVPNLGKAAALILEHVSDLPAFLSEHPKGKQLPGYLSALAAHLDIEREETLNDLSSLGHHIEHIKEIVAMQQSYARVAGVMESLSLNDLVEDALRINEAGMERHSVQVTREYGQVPAFMSEKHKILQILVNLIRNAKYALDDGPSVEKRLVLRTEQAPVGKARVLVIDNGVGIPVENLTRIFAHGFTTRKGGHGFGLHHGALAAKELGGGLIAMSPGPGQGATFVLELPCESKEENQ